MKRAVVLTLVLGLILGACDPSGLKPPAPEPTLTPLQPAAVVTLPQPLATQTVPPDEPAPLPTQTGLPATPTAASELPALQGTAYPQPAEAITSENAARVSPLARWGKGALNQIALSPDGTSLAAAGDLGLYIYAADTLEQQRFFPTGISLKCLAFSPDGQTLASGSTAGILLWDLPSGQVRSEMGGDQHDFVNALAFSPDGKLLASGTSYATIDLWDPASGELLFSHGYDPYFWTDTLAFSPDGKLLASGQQSSGQGLGIVLLWDLSTQEIVNRYEQEVRVPYVGSLAFSPDSKTVALASSQAAAILWDTATNAATQVEPFESGWVYSVAFSPDGTTLAAGTQEGKIILWGIASGTKLHTLQTQAGPVNSLVFSADGQRLYSGSEDGLRLWDASSGSLLLSNLDHTPLGAVISFSPDGQRLASYTKDVVTTWEAQNGAQAQTFAGGEFVAVAPNWSLLAAASTEDRGILLLYDLESGELLRQVSNDSNKAEIDGMAFSPGGEELAQVENSFRNILILWDTASGNQIRQIQGEDQFSGAVAISPNAQTLAAVERVLDTSASIYQMVIQLWDVSSGEKLAMIDPEEGMVQTLAFSPDDKILAFQTFNTISLWDLESNTLLKKLDQGISYRLAFSPDGKLLAAGGWSGDPLITLWDVASGAQLARLGGHNLETTGLAFTLDGRLLASSAEDGSILLWGVRP